MAALDYTIETKDGVNYIRTIPSNENGFWLDKEPMIDHKMSGYDGYDAGLPFADKAAFFNLIQRSELKKAELAVQYDTVKNTPFTHTDGNVFAGGAESGRVLDETHRIRTKRGAADVKFYNKKGRPTAYKIPEADEILTNISEKAMNDWFDHRDKLIILEDIIDGSGTISEKIILINAVI